MAIKDIVTGDVDDDKSEYEKLVANLPVKFEPRCKICKSEFRPIIDRLIVGGNSFVMIAEQFRGKDSQLTGSIDAIRKSVERHSKKHLSVRDAAVRQILEQKARESGVLVETVREQLVSAEAMLELAVKKGTEQLGDPDARIKYQDAIKAAELLRDKKYEEMSQQVEMLSRQVQAIQQGLQELVPPELFPALIERIKEIYEGKVRPTSITQELEPAMEEEEPIYVGS